MDLAEYHLLVVVRSNGVKCETNARDVLKRRATRSASEKCQPQVPRSHRAVAAPPTAVHLAHLMIVVFELKVHVQPRPAAIRAARRHRKGRSRLRYCSQLRNRQDGDSQLATQAPNTAHMCSVSSEPGIETGMVLVRIPRPVGLLAGTSPGMSAWRRAWLGFPSRNRETRSQSHTQGSCRQLVAGLHRCLCRFLRSQRSTDLVGPRERSTQHLIHSDSKQTSTVPPSGRLAHQSLSITICSMSCCCPRS